MFYCGVVGGIMVIVSYNLIDYNGMKLVCEDVCLISGDIGLCEIECKVEVNIFGVLVLLEGVVMCDYDKFVYINYLLGYIDIV